MTARRCLVASALALLLATAGCFSLSEQHYVSRMGLLMGEKSLLDLYEQAITAHNLASLQELFDRDPTAQRGAATTIVELGRKLAPVLGAGGTLDFVESEVRDFDLFAEPPTATFYFHLGGRDAAGVRHQFTIRSDTTFRELGREPAEHDPENVPVARLCVAAQAPYTCEHESAQHPQFEDVTAKVGLANRHRNQIIQERCLILPGTMPGSGAAAADFDGDGALDLVAIDGQRSLLYINRGDGTFDERGVEWGLDVITGSGCVAADYDNDGDQDLFVCDHFGGSKLLRNDLVDGKRRFVDVTAEAGVGVADPVFSAAFGDVDRDGDLDLYVPCAGDYYKQIPAWPFAARDGRPNRLFINDGHGHFTEEGHARGVDDMGWGLACGFCDYDGDGDDDLYVANDFGVNELFQNDGTGHFVDVASSAGATDRGYGMGVSWGDVNGDGHFDVYISDIYSEYASVFCDPDYPMPLLGRLFRLWVGRLLTNMGHGNALLLSDGHGHFTDVGKQWRVNECGWAWAGMFLDRENDGDLDIYCPDGSYTGSSAEDLELKFWSLSSLMWQHSKDGKWVFDTNGRSLHGHERNRMFEQTGPGRFTEIGYLDGVNAIETGRGLALGDFDDDGYVDMYLRNLNDEARYFHNVGGANHWLKLALEGTTSNRDAVGAAVRAKTAAGTQLRQVTAGDGFYSSQDKRVLFGLGTASAADVEIRWPSGRVESFANLAADRAYHLVEGRGAAEPVAPRTSERAKAPAR